MKVGVTMKKVKPTSVGGLTEKYIFGKTKSKSRKMEGVAEGYIFGETKEGSSPDRGYLTIYKTLRRENLEDFFDRTFRPAIEEMNREKTEKYEAYRQACRDRKEARKNEKKEWVAKGLSKEAVNQAMARWDELNPRPQEVAKPTLVDLENQSVLDYYKKNQKFSKNLFLDLVGVIGDMDIYNPVNKYGVATGLSQEEALVNRKIYERVMTKVVERWNDEFPQLPIVMAGIHQDGWSSHSHLKCVPIAYYEGDSNDIASVAPGYHRALEQMDGKLGFKPRKVLSEETGIMVEPTEIEVSKQRIEHLYRKMDGLIESEMAKYEWEKEFKGATEQDHARYVSQADLDFEVKKLQGTKKELEEERIPELSMKVEEKQAKIKEADRILADRQREEQEATARKNAQLLRLMEFDRLAREKEEEKEVLEKQLAWKSRDLARATEVLGAKPKPVGEVTEVTLESGAKLEIPKPLEGNQMDYDQLLDVYQSRKLVTEGVLKRETTRVEVEHNDLVRVINSSLDHEKEVRALRSFGARALKALKEEQGKRMAAENLLKSDLLLRPELEKERQRNGFEEIQALQTENRQLKQQIKDFDPKKTQEYLELKMKNKELTEGAQRLSERNWKLFRENETLQAWKSAAIKIYEFLEDYPPTLKAIEKWVPQWGEMVRKERYKDDLEAGRINPIQNAKKSYKGPTMG